MAISIRSSDRRPNVSQISAESIHRAEMRNKASATMLYRYAGIGPNGSSRLCIKVRFQTVTTRKHFNGGPDGSLRMEVSE
jgi:hypothetical protein